MQNERIKETTIQNERICHVLWGCPFARNVWSMASRWIQKCSNSVLDFFELFQTMVTRLNQQELESWAVIVWAVWNAWNKFYFEKTQLQPRHIYDGASGLSTDYQHLMAAQTSWVYSVLSCISLLHIFFLTRGLCFIEYWPVHYFSGVHCVCFIVQLVKFFYFNKAFYLWSPKKKKLLLLKFLEVNHLKINQLTLI